MKPGAHGLVWAIPRTSHWTATALENAGFEIRDVVTHLFGTGFPKSHGVSKAIDKAAGAERRVIGKKSDFARDGSTRDSGRHNKMNQRPYQGSNTEGKSAWDEPVTVPATPEAEQWNGWGTALKPASEHWILVRKPLSEKTVAANVLKWGTGGINVDGCRVETNDGYTDNRVTQGVNTSKTSFAPASARRTFEPGSGRFPANVTLDETAAEMLDEQSGELGRSSGGGMNRDSKGGRNAYAPGINRLKKRNVGHGDTGGASRFFYVAKASKSDRGEGNTHPTVKSTALMRWLCRLVTPPGGIVLDPFTGSGSTGVAAMAEGFRFIGLEQNREYVDLARGRIRAARQRSRSA
jgi:site-specific DNA-methyltransferase (adenine-specific)